MKKLKIPMILGPTAVGKTSYAIGLARSLGGEVISMDSMQIYKYLNIGTAKPTPEEQGKVRHHLIDFVEPNQNFSVYEYSVLARKTMDELIERGITPVLCGGTGLYAHSLIYDMDFGSAGTREHSSYSDEDRGDLIAELEKRGVSLSPDDRGNTRRLARKLQILSEGGPAQDFEKSEQKRSTYDFDIIVLNRPREELYNRINLRVDAMFEEGLVEEVRGLLARGYSLETQAMRAIAYSDVAKYLGGSLSLEDCKEDIKRTTRRYAKRQLTWFRRYEEARWVEL